MLAPVENGGLRILAPASLLVDGKFGVRVRRGAREVFVFKQQEVEATPERLAALQNFVLQLNEILETRTE